MKKIILILAIFTCIFSFVQTASAVVIDEKKDAGYISLSGSAVKEVEPNIARITFAVENTGYNAQIATEENNKVSNSIINALKAITIEGTDKIKTTDFSVRPVYHTVNGKRTIKSYTAVNSVNVETKDIKKVAQFIDTAIANGANRVNGLNYSYENDRKICTELYPELIKSLKAQASTLASAAGTSLNGLKHMNASCSMDNIVSRGKYYAMNSAMDSVAAEGISTPVEAGKVKVNVFVNADFYVK